MGLGGTNKSPTSSGTRRTPIQEGMVLALEPHEVFWRLQDMVYVTVEDPRLLPDKMSTSEMFVVDG